MGRRRADSLETMSSSPITAIADSPLHAARPSGRRGDIDWLRGLAILIMIEAHTIDAWTRPSDRAAPLFGYAKVLGGFAAPLFLFLAGLAVVLAIGGSARKTGDLEAAVRKVRRRGWQIFGLAFLFRFQSFAFSPATLPWQMLKVDILNIMGLAIVAAASLAGVARRPLQRVLAFGTAAVLVTLATPIVFQTPLLAFLPDPLEAYLRPVPRFSGFMLFPWAGFVFAGALAGTLLDGRRDRRADSRLHAWLAAGGLVFAVASYYAWYLPSPYARTDFWSTSPSFFFMRTGILVAAVGLVYFQHLLPPLTALGRARPMQRFGRSSLLVYWVHVEIAYGVLTRPLYHRLPLDRSIAGFVALSLLMYLMVVVKDAIKVQRKARRVETSVQRATYTVQSVS